MYVSAFFLVLTPENWSTLKVDANNRLLQYGCWDFIESVDETFDEIKLSYKEKLDRKLGKNCLYTLI